MFRLKRSGYDVIPAYDGAEALNKIRDLKPDLIILDVMLPIVNGFKVCEILKKDPNYSAIPVIIFTAKTQEEDIRKAKEAGAEGYISKPFESRELLSKINELLSRQHK